MSEKLIVKNFGPIKHVELDIKKVNVLIGEQGTGKSTLVKLLNLFSSEGFLFGDEESHNTLIDLYDFSFKNNTSISYSTANYLITYGNGQFTINYGGPHKDILKRFNDVSTELLKKHNFSVSDEFYSLKEWFVKTIGNCNYIPAERIGITSINQRRSEKGRLDQYIIDFELYFSQAIKIKELEIPFLKNVTYKSENSIDVVIVNGERLFLYQTSSGFQSSIPMAVVIEFFTSIKDKISFIIEEPELNLFPTTQYDLIKYFIEKTSEDKNGLFLATHSPYIITSLNNMMYAYQTGQKNPEQVAGIIEKKYWLNPDEVSAYRLLEDGTAKNILDDELKQINAGEIDEISRSINDKWDKIADIEFSKA